MAMDRRHGQVRLQKLVWFFICHGGSVLYYEHMMLNWDAVPLVVIYFRGTQGYMWLNCNLGKVNLGSAVEPQVDRLVRGGLQGLTYDCIF